MNKDISPRFEKPVKTTAAIGLFGATVLGITGCSSDPDPREIGNTQQVSAISIQEGANLRKRPERTLDGVPVLDELVEKLSKESIKALRDNNDADSKSTVATIEIPSGEVREYTDRNGVWFGILTEDIIADACSTDIKVDPFSENAIDDIKTFREGCEAVENSLQNHDIVWVNQQTATPVLLDKPAN